MQNGVSEIDDERFFFAKDGKYNAHSELNSTIDALFNEVYNDDKSAACRFPARKIWLAKKLKIDNFPLVECKEYNAILKRLNPKSVTLVFPSAHINSPASMFGHTFLRINSGYNSKLLSYAVNYAADANPDKENAVSFAIKGLFGGYFGKYSLLPYYDKLKEYRDSEQRDIWEYDLNISEEETLRMVEHIWELNETRSYYYFFTENCSYNMLWFLEIARDELYLREHFNYQVIPLETVHVANKENLIVNKSFRPSKRTTLLKYEELIERRYIKLPIQLAASQIDVHSVTSNSSIDIQQKRYILEASIELLEFNYSKNKVEKTDYLALFYKLSKARAMLKKGEIPVIKTPPNPIESHRAIRTTIGTGVRDSEAVGYLGIRPAYHDLADSGHGFLRGTQIEFMDFEFSHVKNKTQVEKATILSIVSIAQRSDFFKNLSWRTKFGWDRSLLERSANFSGSVGVGQSYGNELGYAYVMVDPLFYFDGGIKPAIGSSIGFVLDKYSSFSTKIEATKRFYNSSITQNIINLSQNFRVSQNTQIQLIYDFKDRYMYNIKGRERNLKLAFNYYF